MHTSLKLRTAILPLFLMAGQVIANEPAAGSAGQPGGWVSTEQKLGNGSDVAVKPDVPATTAKPDNRTQQLYLLDEIISSTQSVDYVSGYAEPIVYNRDDDTTLVFTGVDVQGPIQGGRVDTVKDAVNYTGKDSAIELIKAGGSVLRQGGDLAQACTDACKPSSASVVYIQPKTEEGGKKPDPIAVEVTTTELLALAGVSSAADGFNTSNLQTALAATATPEQALKAAALADYMTGGVGAEGKATLWDSISSGVDGGTATRPEDLQYQAALQGSSVGVATNARIELIGALVDEYKSEFNVSDSEALRMAQNYMDAAYDRPMAAGGGGVFDLAPASPEISAKYGNIAVVDDLLVEGKYSLGSGLADRLFADGLYVGTLGTGGVGNTLSPGQLASEINSGSLSGSGIGAGLNSANTTIPTFQTGVAHTIGGPGTGGVIPTSPSSPVGGGYYGGSGSGDGKYDGAFSWVNDIMLPSTDMIYISLKRMFGGPIETIYQSVIDPSTGRFRKEQGEFTKSSMPPTASTFVVTSLLWIVLVFSALIVVYIFIYGMYRTAKDGQIMGKEWSAIWVPGRAIISTVSIMPIPVVGNFSAIQVFIIMCALLGTAFASTIAAAGFSMMLTQPVIEPVPKEKDGFVADIAKSHLCLASMKKIGILKSEQAIVGYSYVDAGGKMTGNSMASDTNEVKTVNTEDGWAASFFRFFSGDKTPDDIKNKNLFIADIFNKSRIDPTRFGVNVAAYGPHGICGVAYLPVHPAEKLVLSDEIMDNISGYEGRKVSVDVKTNLGDLAGGSLVGAAEKSAANSSADDGSGKNPNDDAIVTTLSETAVKTDIWRKELGAARDASMLESFKVLDSRVAAAIEKYVNRAPDSSRISDSAAANVPAESVLASELTLINKEFYQGMIASTQAALQNINDPSTTIAKTTVRQLGWFSLGTMYWVIEKRQAVLMELFDFTALVHGAGNGRVSDDLYVKYQKDADRLKTVELIDRVVGYTGIRFAKEALQNAEKGIDISPSWLINYMVGPLLRASALADIDNFNVSPIERVRHFGVVYTDAYILAVMGVSYLRAKMAGAGKLPLIGAAGGFGESLAESVLGLLGKIAEPLFVGAFICANIIPALPYAMMMAAAVGYLIYVVEALIGANWWMLMAAHPDGHDVWGKGGAGFPIVLTLILRPSLIVIGFFMGVTFNWVVGHWINVTIMPAHNIQNSDTWLHLTQIGGLMLVFSGLHLFAAYKSFSLTWELPNAILRWMGIQDHQDLGEREGKENIMALGMSGGRSMSPVLAGGGKKKTGGNGEGEGEGEGDKGKKDRKDKGGEVDPNTDKTPPGAGPGGASDTKTQKSTEEGV